MKTITKIAAYRLAAAEAGVNFEDALSILMGASYDFEKATRRLHTCRLSPTTILNSEEYIPHAKR